MLLRVGLTLLATALCFTIAFLNYQTNYAQQPLVETPMLTDGEGLAEHIDPNANRPLDINLPPEGSPEDIQPPTQDKTSPPPIQS